MHDQALGIIPLDAGPRLATCKGGIVHAVRPPGRQRYLAGSHLAAVLLSPSPGVRASVGGGRLEPAEGKPGTVFLCPAGVEGHVHWASSREKAMIALSPEQLTELAGREFGNEDVELRPPRFGVTDKRALQLGLLMKAELARGEPLGELCIDSLITLFAVHLLRRYAGSMPLVSPTGGLSAYAARRVQEYIEAHVAARLTVVELAAVADLSPGHFIHAFTRTFGRTPHRYLVDRRLDHAQKLLAETDLTIADIAYRSGFSSQSHLTASMRKLRHLTPGQIRGSLRVD